MEEAKKKLEELKDLAVAQSCLSAQLFSVCDQITREMKELEPSVYLEARIRSEYLFRKEIYKKQWGMEMPQKEIDIWEDIAKAIREAEKENHE